jgi:acyl-CoA reductase-like NAD-dependent aldehyde dehydrogenase
MIKVVQAYDRAPFAEVQSDDADALEIKLEAARRAFLDRDGWLVPHERIAVLRRLAKLLGGKVNHFARLI